MQNNESNQPNSGFRRFFKEKGYYMLLCACLVVVGVSGYFFVSGAMSQRQEAQEALSVPVKPQEPETKPSTSASASSNSDTGAGSKPSTAKDDPEDVAPSTSDKAPASAQVEEEAVTVAPVAGSVVNDYAMESLTYNATTKDWRVHCGVDLAAAEGEAVLAARDGTVTAVYDDEDYGMTVVVQHDDGYTSHYSNLAEPAAVSAGQTVSAGDTLGTVGATALLEVAQEPHLHFAVYCDGVAVDPDTFLS